MRTETILMGLLIVFLLSATAATAAVNELTLTSPNGGEVWSGTHNITWNADNGNPDLTVNIEWSTNDDGNWQLITSGEANDGSFTWDTTTQWTDSKRYLVQIHAFDVANNEVAVPDFSDDFFTVDNTAPTTTISVMDEPVMDGQFLTSTTSITLTADDATSGVAATYYQVNDGQAVAYVGPFSVEGDDGANTITYWSVDKAGNEEQHNTVTVSLDNSAPVTIAMEDPATDGENGWHDFLLDGGMYSKVHLVCTDSGVGPFLLHYKWDTDEVFTPGPEGFANVDITIPGAHVLTFYCSDKFGHDEEPKTLAVKFKDGTPFVVGAAPVSLPGAPELTLLFTNLPSGGPYHFNVEQSPISGSDTGGLQIGSKFFKITSDLPNGEFQVTLTFSYADVDNDGLVDGTFLTGNNLNAYYHNGVGWLIISDPVIDTNLHTVTITVNHFTEFALLGSPSTSSSSGSGGGGGGGGGSHGAVGGFRKPTTSNATTTTTTTTQNSESQSTSPAVQEADSAAPEEATGTSGQEQDSGSTGITGAAVADGSSSALGKTGKVVAVVLAVLAVAGIATLLWRKRK